MTTYDWSSLMAQAGQAMEPLPPAEYDVQITSAESKPSSTGKLMIACRMQVIGGPHAGRPVYNNFTLSPENPNALGFFFQHMKVLGLDASFFNANPAPETVAESLKGRQCRVKLGIRTYQGSPRNNVERVMPFMGVATGMPTGMPGMPGAAPMPTGMPPMPPPGVPTPPAPPGPPPASVAPPAPPMPPAPPVAPAAPPAPPAPPMPPAPPTPPVAAPAPPMPPMPPMPPQGAAGSFTPPTPPPPPAAAPPPPPVPEPQPQPQYYVDPATGQRWDGTQWLPPETNGAAVAPPAPPVPPAPATTGAVPAPPF